MTLITSAEHHFLLHEEGKGSKDPRSLLTVSFSRIWGIYSLYMISCQFQSSCGQMSSLVEHIMDVYTLPITSAGWQRAPTATFLSGLGPLQYRVGIVGATIMMSLSTWARI